MGMASRKAFSIALLNRLSRYPEYALATLAVPMAYSRIRFQPITKPTSSPEIS